MLGCVEVKHFASVDVSWPKYKRDWSGRVVCTKCPALTEYISENGPSSFLKTMKSTELGAELADRPSGQPRPIKLEEMASRPERRAAWQ